jgi:hypothetical protein
MVIEALPFNHCKLALSCNTFTVYDHIRKQVNSGVVGDYRCTWLMYWGLDSKSCIICWIWGFCSICCIVPGSRIPPATPNDPRSGKPRPARPPMLGSPLPAPVVGTVPAGVWLTSPPPAPAPAADTTTIQNNHMLKVQMGLKIFTDVIWWLPDIKLSEPYQPLLYICMTNCLQGPPTKPVV